MIKENQMELGKGIKATPVKLRINTRGDIEYYPIATQGDKYLVNRILGMEQATPLPPKLLAELNKSYRKGVRKSALKRGLKKYGKIGLWLFIAYQVIGLAVLAFNFETIWNESINAGQTIAQQITGEK
jgi:hypothetical protein